MARCHTGSAISIIPAVMDMNRTEAFIEAAFTVRPKDIAEARCERTK
jgi:hypothetical protein